MPKGEVYQSLNLFMQDHIEMAKIFVTFSDAVESHLNGQPEAYKQAFGNVIKEWHDRMFQTPQEIAKRQVKSDVLATAQKIVLVRDRTEKARKAEDDLEKELQQERDNAVTAMPSRSAKKQRLKHNGR